MARKWTRSDYAEAAKSLRRFGYDITYKANDRKTFRQRGVIRRLFDDKIAYIRGTERSRTIVDDDGQKQDFTFKFQKLTNKQKQIAIDSGLFTRGQFTKHGLFLEKPVNIASKDYKVEFLKSGVRIKGASRLDVIVPLNSKAFVVDPEKEIDRAVNSQPEPNTYSLMCGPYRYGNSFSKRQMTQYLSNELLFDWLDPEGKYFHQGNTREKFADVFKLRFIYRQQ